MRGYISGINDGSLNAYTDKAYHNLPNSCISIIKLSVVINTWTMHIGNIRDGALNSSNR